MTTALKRVVVTGLGLVTPLGVGVPVNWQRLVAGESGIRRLDADQYQGLPCQIAGQIPKKSEMETLKWPKTLLDYPEAFWDPLDYLDKASARRLPLFVQYALAGATEALKDSGLSEHEMRSAGVAVGSSIGGLEAFYDNAVNFANGGYRKVSPLFIPSLLNNMAAGHISIQHGLKGPNHSVSTACTTGAHAVGDAFNMIRLGMSDVMVSGSSEAVVHPLAVAGFSRARSLATKYNNDPEVGSRPFDKHRDGFVMGEGSGILVLESLDHAIRRGAHIHAEIIGYGLSGDANHITAPSETGEGAFNCMRMAMSTAPKGTLPDYINAHATSTLLGDAAENRAIGKLYESLGAADGVVNVSSTKGATGHLLGASGSVEAIYTIMSTKNGILPPTRNITELGDEFTFNYVPKTSQKHDVTYALTNSFGFGGTNASLLVKNYKN